MVVGGVVILLITDESRIVESSRVSFEGPESQKIKRIITRIQRSKHIYTKKKEKCHSYYFFYWWDLFQCELLRTNVPREARYIRPRSEIPRRTRSISPTVLTSVRLCVKAHPNASLYHLYLEILKMYATYILITIVAASMSKRKPKQAECMHLDSATRKQMRLPHL